MFVPWKILLWKALEYMQQTLEADTILGQKKLWDKP